jgi:serine/threonine protein kinase/Tol biopolymer transport system component
MPLPAGTRFGPFEIISLIGAGGMGEVYRARDTKLDRDVAVKVLAAAFISDPERLARFEREAKALASLNHPHVAHIYGLEDGSPTGASGPVRAIVMELVEGEDLAGRLARGPLPIAETIRIARQIADAVAAAHDAGIVHRDLKPANIKVTPDGTVKVLDFGLAKAFGHERGTESSTNLANSPTITAAGTLQGIILGTAAYMSPEQARGLAVDARTDVWAFGCVMYEMLTGRVVYAGPTVSDTIAKILEREPDWHALPASTPASLRRLLARCLEKDPKRRLHSIADTHFEIDEASTELAGQSPQATHPRARWPIVAAIAAVVLAGVSWVLWTTRTSELPPPRVLALTSYTGIESAPTFSPDGRQVAFSWGGEQGDNEDIYVVLVGTDQPYRITKDAARDVVPAWQPDGTQIAFARLAAGRASIYLVSFLGGSEQKLADFAAIHRAAVGGAPENSDPRLSWSPDGRWLAVANVASGSERGVFLVRVADRTTRQLITPAQASDDYRMAVFSPKGDALACINGGFVEVAQLKAGDPQITDAPRRVTPFLGSVLGLAWSADGRDLVFGRAQFPAPNPPYLWRVPASGDRPPERIDLAGVGAFPAVSPTGSSLAFVRRNLNEELLTLREGQPPEPLLSSTSNEQDASISPDGKKVAFATDRAGEGLEIWVAQLADSSTRRSVTKGAHKPEGSPRWSPDGLRLAFDGLGDDGSRHVYIVDEAGGPIREVPQKAGFNDQIPSWSQDGQWIYFGSNRTDRYEIWRAPAAGGEPQQVTTTGGSAPFESDGQLYFLREVGGVPDVFTRPVAGRPERALGIDVSLWNFLPVTGGLYYVRTGQGQRPPYTYEVRFIELATGNSRTLRPLQMAANAPGLSVSPDRKTVLISGVAEITQDLMRIENFR